MGLRIKLTGRDEGLGGRVMSELIFGIKDKRMNSIKDREVERNQGQCDTEDQADWCG